MKLLSQRGPIDEDLLRQRMPGGRLIHDDVVFELDPQAPTEVCVVQNYLKYDTRISAKRGFVWKWDNEPIVRQDVVRGYDRVYSHARYPRAKRRIVAPPILNWWVGKTFDELTDLAPPSKTDALSAIASTKADIPGHVRRSAFIDLVAEEFSEAHIFGRGRQNVLSDKWDGLAPYRYSIAIENTSAPDYWTEKISDCFLSYTVPIYFGAPNIGDYFPEGSFIWLPMDQPELAAKILREALKSDSWESRVNDLKVARELVLHQYSLFAQISRRVRTEANHIWQEPMESRLVYGRRRKRGGWVRGVGLDGNARALLAKRRARKDRSLRENS